MRDVWRALERWGLVLLQDARLPSVATLVAGGPVTGSWWGHPRGKAIFKAAGELEDSPDVLVAHLVDGKVTFVHRRLWPAVIAVGRAREPWQLQGLGSAARTLLARLDAEGTVRGASGKGAKDLVRTLLVHSREVHTDSGAHALELVSWDRFLAGVQPPPVLPEPAAARAELEKVVRALDVAHKARGRLPWRGAPGG